MKTEDNLIKCLNHGFVRLVDSMGDDQRIVDTARVSYGKGTKKLSEDKSLIAYLIEHKHTSPLEQVVFTFHIKMPIFIARQHLRHRTARANEYSGRFSEMADEYYVPPASRMKFQSKSNKQGSDSETIEHADNWVSEINHNAESTFNLYKDLLDTGLARETARINLPLSTYTQFYWQMDLHNLMHYIKLRMDSHAQEEIRVYAKAMLQLIRPIVPLAVEAYEEYSFGSVTFSKTEMRILRELLALSVDEDGALQNWKPLIKMAAYNNDWSERRTNAFIEKIGLDKL